MKRVRIHVTKDDIKSGAVASPESCPIALAIKREMADTKWKHVLVEANRVCLVSPDNSHRWAGLGDHETAFVQRYDDPHLDPEWEPMPFEFDLELPSEPAL